MFPKRKGSALYLWQGKWNSKRTWSLSMAFDTKFPHLIRQNEDKGPTPKDFTDTHWHCKQHSSILHEKHLGTAFAFAITHVETFLQWLLVTKKQKGVGRGLVQFTGLHNIICNHRTQRDQSCNQRSPMGRAKAQGCSCNSPNRYHSKTINVLMFEVYSLWNNKSAYWTQGLGLDLECSQVVGICHWTVPSFTHPNLEVVISRILWIFLCPTFHQIFAHFCLNVNLK